MQRSSESRRQEKKRQSEQESKRLRAERQALAASSAREASVASDAEMVDDEQLGGEKPVSSIGVSHILRFDHDDTGCKRSERGQVQESRGAMCETF